jgi:hypothetical protein
MSQPHPRVAAGLLVAALGAFLALAVLLYPQGLRAPAWVVYAAAMAFFLAGCQLVARARGYRRLQAWLPVALLACLTAPAVWIAFGPGPRRCGVALTVPFLSLVSTRNDLLCRIGFGLGAIVCMGILLIAARHALRSSRDPG